MACDSDKPSGVVRHLPGEQETHARSASSPFPGQVVLVTRTVDISSMRPVRVSVTTSMVVRHLPQEQETWNRPSPPLYPIFPPFPGQVILLLVTETVRDPSCGL